MSWKGAIARLGELAEHAEDSAKKLCEITAPGGFSRRAFQELFHLEESDEKVPQQNSFSWHVQSRDSRYSLEFRYEMRLQRQDVIMTCTLSTGGNQAVFSFGYKYFNIPGRTNFLWQINAARNCFRPLHERTRCFTNFLCSIRRKAAILQEMMIRESAGRVRSRLVLSDGIVERYARSLRSRLVILAGVSGTGKTQLAARYAEASGNRSLIVPVAPSWTCNEDLLGFFNPLENRYRDTACSQFLREANAAWDKGDRTTEYHLILDEMNLARVEHYFSSLLSKLEEFRNRAAAQGDGSGKDIFLVEPMHDEIETFEQVADDGEKFRRIMTRKTLHPGIRLPENLRVIGTVNIDETTSDISDKVHDRAQIIEIPLCYRNIEAHVEKKRNLAGDCRKILLDIWSIVRKVSPFAFRTIDQIDEYLQQCDDRQWKRHLDEMIVQKILPRIRGEMFEILPVLKSLEKKLGDGDYPLARNKLGAMKKGRNGFVSFFIF